MNWILVFFMFSKFDPVQTPVLISLILLFKYSRYIDSRIKDRQLVLWLCDRKHLIYLLLLLNSRDMS